jgi:hypothetical protein
MMRVRIEKITRARPLLECEGVPDEDSIYVDVFGWSPRYQGPRQGGIGEIAFTDMILMDVPPLRDSDDVLIMYSAFGRDTRTKAWAGAGFFKSLDGGSNYSVVHWVNAESVYGRTINALGDWTVGNTFDTANTLDIVLTNGSLSTVSDFAVYNGANLAAVQTPTGIEIIQFANAELVGDNIWRISRILRGRKGTERFTGTHVPWEPFALLSVMTTYNTLMPMGEINLLRHYKAVSNGKALDDALEIPLVLEGNSIKPLSPINIVGEWGGGDVDITWTRRARINAEWKDTYDVPLDEPTESYEIDIMDGATVVRTLTASVPTVTYTAAQQTTDFGLPQSAGTVSVRIYQMSARIGRGHSGTATV